MPTDNVRADAGLAPGGAGTRLRARIAGWLRSLRGVPLERRILLVAAASLLPLGLLSGVTLVTAARDQKTRLLEAHVQTALTLSAAVDAEIGNVIASLDTLAASPRLALQDYPGLQQVSQELLSRRPTWLNVVVSTLDGVQVMNARMPVQAGALLTAGPVTQAARMRRPFISDLATGPAFQQSAFGVHVPVENGGQVQYVLSAVISPAALADLVRLHPVPNRGVVTIVDRNHRVVARSRDAEQSLGRSATGPLLERLRQGGSGWVASLTLDGAPVYSVYHASTFSGWAALIGMPVEVLDSPLLWSYVAVAASILVSVLLGLLAAVRVGRTIVRPMRELESSAASVGRGEAPLVPRTALPEVRRVGEALVSAHHERERALDRERDARRAAEGASQAKDEFLAMLGHELRNPLAAIASASHLLERDRDALKPLQASAAGIVSRQVKHLARMTDDLLDAGRIVLGKIVLTRTRMDLAQAVQAAMAAMRSGGQFEHHQVSLRTESAWIDADATRIEQITLNLLGNAVKYTPQGGVIHVEVLHDADEVVLRVTDSGIGLDAQLLSRVFDLFVQGERSIDRSQGGLGIGLTLVRRLAELHGGSARAQSAGAGQGATFTVRLPASAGPSSSPDVATVRSGIRPLRIAVVEDNDDVRLALRHLLEMDGHHVREASDGRAGLDLLLAGAGLDVALVDVGLPEIGGMEIARTVRRSGGPIPLLVAMTGYGGDQQRALGLASGFDAYLVKPVDPELLRTVLADRLGPA